MNNLAKRGQKYLQIILINVIFIDLALSFLDFSLSPTRWEKNLVRLILTGFLLFFVYQGYSWAKWIFSMLAVPTAIIIAILALVALTSKPFLALLCFFIACFYGFAGISVHRSREIRSFLKYQRSKDV